MLAHLSFGVHSLEREAAFYGEVLRPLGYLRVSENEQSVGFGERGVPTGSRCSRDLARLPRPVLGFTWRFSPRADRQWMRSTRRQLRQVAGTPVHPARGYGPHCYAAFIIDLDGYKLEAKHE
jgi:hypothetical protein